MQWKLYSHCWHLQTVFLTRSSAKIVCTRILTLPASSTLPATSWFWQPWLTDVVWIVSITSTTMDRGTTTATMYLAANYLIDSKTRMWVWKGCGIVLGILFFFGCFFFLVGGGFGGCPGSFLGKPQGWKAGSCGFSGHLGVVLGPSRLRSGGNQWWNAGSIQVWTQKTASKSKLSRSFLFSVCIYLCWCVCVCLW